MLKIPFSLRLLCVCGLALLAAACSDPEVKKARHFEQGKAHMAAGKVADAILEFRNALQVDSHFGDARYELAQAYEKAGNTEAAVREFIRAADLLTDRVDVQIKAGTLLLAGQQFEQARKHADLALKADPKSVEAQIIRAYTLAGLKDMEGAIAELERASEASPGDYRPYAGLGAMEASTGNMAEAEAAFRKAVLADPSSAPAKLALGYFLWSAQKTGEAEAVIKQVIEADAKNAPANRLLALLYAATKRVRDAEAPLLRLVNMNDMRAMLVLGDLYVATERVDQGRALYERLKADPGAREIAVARLAGVDFRAGRRAEARAALDAQLAETPKSVELLTLKSQMLAVDGLRKEALDVAREAVAADAKSAQAHYVLGIAESENRNLDAAISAHREALKLNPGMPAAQIELSRLLLADGQTDQALQFAQSAQKAAPQSVQARLNLVRALLQKGDLRVAEADARALTQQIPGSSTAHALYGRALLARSDAAGAMRAFDRALELNPADTDALAGRLSIDFARKRPEDGRGRIERALAKAPENSAVLVIAARFERMDGKSPAAEAHLRKAIEIDPANLTAYNQLAAIYLSQNRLDDGKRELQELVRRRPDAVPARTMIGIIEQAQGRDEEAIKVYDAILKETSTAAVAANNLAYLYADRGERLDLALQLAQTAKQQLPDNADVSDTLGWAYYKKGIPELAIRALEFSVQKNPKNALYQLHLGLAYAKAGKAVEARSTLTTALQLNANIAGANEARAVLSSMQNVP